MTGFGNEFASEAIENTLPKGQNNPQQVAYGLYAEQLTGSAFTAPRGHNLRSWLYRIRPSVVHGTFEPYTQKTWFSAPFEGEVSPNQLRWDAPEFPKNPICFLDAMHTVAGGGAGAALGLTGLAIHTYAITNSMGAYFYNADGELLIVPQEGALDVHTEMGNLYVEPKEICVIPRGVKFRVYLPEGQKQARGYVCENYGQPFELPNLGPIGANGLANPRDFETPVAAYEDKAEKARLVAKMAGKFWVAELQHSPLDVVAWHGNYAPYKYDLTAFNTMNTVSFDHPDPSIFTVLTSPSTVEGVANVDFVIFPPRWMVAENTFRPPYYHRNLMSEFMGLIEGQYDAKEEGFVPGGCSLHNQMSAHGPDAQTFEKASKAKLTPEKQEGTMAFMFESRLLLHPTKQAMDAKTLQGDYAACWQGLKAHFSK